MLRVIHLFAGIGAPESALDRLGADYEVVAFAEIDPAAVASYCAVHGVDPSRNLGDVSKVAVGDVPDCDMLFGGFPCQDISVAGKTQGFFDAQGGHTRSGQVFEMLRIMEAKRPRTVIMENVKNLVGKKFKGDFDALVAKMESMGYHVEWRVLNATDYGVPQHRERVFIVCTLDGEAWSWPEPVPLTRRLRDVLIPAEQVPQRYYLSDKMMAYFRRRTEDSERHGWGFKLRTLDRDEGVAHTVSVHDGQRVVGNFVGEPKLAGVFHEGGQNFRVHSADGVSPTVNWPHDSPVKVEVPREPEPFGRIPSRRQMGNVTGVDGPARAVIAHEPNMIGMDGVLPVQDVVHRDKAQHGCGVRPDGAPAYTVDTMATQGVAIQTAEIARDDLHEESRRVYSDGGPAPTLNTRGDETRAVKVEVRPAHTAPGPTMQGPAEGQADQSAFALTTRERAGGVTYREVPGGGLVAVRRLMPIECWRLMGFTDGEFARAQSAEWVPKGAKRAKPMSDAQLYRQAGNSIVVDVLAALLRDNLGRLD